MEKNKLAEALRARQRLLGGRQREIIDRQTDSEVISSYATCPDCGEMMASEQQVEELIDKANDMQDFLVFTLIDVMRHDHSVTENTADSNKCMGATNREEK